MPGGVSGSSDTNAGAPHAAPHTPAQVRAPCPEVLMLVSLPGSQGCCKVTAVAPDPDCQIPFPK